MQRGRKEGAQIGADRAHCGRPSIVRDIRSRDVRVPGHVGGHIGWSSVSSWGRRMFWSRCEVVLLNPRSRGRLLVRRRTVIRPGVCWCRRVRLLPDRLLVVVIVWLGLRRLGCHLEDGGAIRSYGHPIPVAVRLRRLQLGHEERRRVAAALIVSLMMRHIEGSRRLRRWWPICLLFHVQMESPRRYVRWGVVLSRPGVVGHPLGLVDCAAAVVLGDLAQEASLVKAKRRWRRHMQDGTGERRFVPSRMHMTPAGQRLIVVDLLSWLLLAL